MPVFDYDPPERFVAGAVGQPGSRAFFLQARAEGRLTTVSLEKFQVAVLADRLDELLDEVLRRSGGIAPVPAVAPPDLADEAPLDQPIMEDFRVGTMALAWDPDSELVIIEAQAMGEEEAGGLLGAGVEDPTVLRVRITPAAARAFSKRALDLVSSGRPACPLCNLPIDPDGHVCPRQNGSRGA
ncbi:DUF3090 domain-containing protein [Rhizohabitans arisaemae]|uniref:DUF3090 domain-containing protein n=1 Tax=Rhizohabitans arisaemae TaxID=2720610 RepID=UPI0024B1AD45|nr:DUF3090 domain-containing protein [Rhizohabitans arisaemae]